MAGSNGSSAQRGAQIPQQWPPETEEQARAREYERWLQEQRAQQAYEQQMRGHAPPASSYPDPAGRAFHGQHGHPHPGPAGPHVDPHGYGHPGGGAPPFGHAPAPAPSDQRGYAPHFERFDPGPPPAPQDGFARYDQQGYAQSPQRPGWDAGQHSGFPPLPPGDPGRQAHSDGRQPGHYPELPGLPGYPAPPQDYDHRQGDPRQDLRSYDLSNYAPGQIPHGYGGDQAHQAPQTWPPGTPEPRWEDGRSQWPPHDQPGAPGTEHAGQGYAQPQHDPRFANVAGGQEGYDHEEAEAVEERRGPSTLVIVGALVGAIIAGGGLAYGYKMLGGGGGAKVKVAEIKAPTSPAKTKPKDPGGKTIEHSDKTFVNRASSDSLPPVPTSLNSEALRDDGAPRKVATTNIVLNRDGSVTPQVSRSTEPPAASSATGVPGLLIDGLNTPPPGPAPGRAAIPPPPPPAALPPPAVRSTLPPAPSEAVTVRSAPPPPPRVADLPLPKVQPREAPPPRAAAPERQPVPKRAAVRDDLPALKSGGAATAAVPDRKAAVGTASGVGAGAAANANGYVAVLASKRNRQEALNSFADIFQKHPDVLAGRTPDVREVNLADKGVWYRLIVGPPGSREAARDLCVKLKARGMADCWPTAY
ncbi:MAG: SPOR domain-containing protein [Hyphomicrobiaceae bacterium]|nr:SPOR domain-containing protein [Hyphomicrobiaceae bacterium]